LYLKAEIIIKGSGSIVGIATAYGLDGPGIESRRWRYISHLSRPAPTPTHPTIQRVPSHTRSIVAGMWH
jgi:hypothetical protein